MGFFNTLYIVLQTLVLAYFLGWNWLALLALIGINTGIYLALIGLQHLSRHPP